MGLLVDSKFALASLGKESELGRDPVARSEVWACTYRGLEGSARGSTMNRNQTQRSATNSFEGPFVRSEPKKGMGIIFTLRGNECASLPDQVRYLEDPSNMTG